MSDYNNYNPYAPSQKRNNTGNQAQQNQQYYNQNVNSTKGTGDTLALFSLIIGIISMIGFCCLGGFLGIVGIILGIIALTNQYCNKKALAITGIVLSAFAFLLTLGVIALGSSESAGTTNTTDTNISYAESLEKADDEFFAIEDNENDSSDKSIKENNDTIKYTVVDIAVMHSELEDNALRAETTYQDKYVEFTGYLDNIDSDGHYITVRATDDEWDWDTIQCYLTKDNHKDIVMQLNSGDKITIQGQITSIGEVLGYSLDIHTIK